MATNVWQGNAPTIAQVSTFAVTGDWATNDTATLTCGSASVTFTVGVTETVGAVVAGLRSLWDASLAGELFELSATDTNPTITLASKVAGVPFTVTASEDTVGSGAIGAQTDTTANSGPNAVDVQANWSLGEVPTDTPANTVSLQGSGVSILYGLEHVAGTMAALIHQSTFTGNVGLPRNNANGYVEYRPTYWELDATEVQIGVGAGSGSPRFNLNSGTVAATVNVYGTGTAPETGVPAFLWKGTHISSVVNVNRGNVGIAFFEGEAANLIALNVTFTTSQLTDSTVICGSGVVWANSQLDIYGGNTTINSNSQNITVRAGSITIAGSATVTSELLLEGGTCYYTSTGTCTLCTMTRGATIDFRRDSRARTFTALVMNGGGTWYDPNGTVTTTNGFDILHANLTDVTIVTSESQTWTPSAP